MIIAGYTSYPWMPDWARFRQIADAVGAYLLADISHIAGMVAAGVVPSPVGHAHVISFTTHKTLYGPRGACILTTDKALAAKVDSAVFPGEQGGPHVNAMAGMAVAFKLAASEPFRRAAGAGGGQRQAPGRASCSASACASPTAAPTRTCCWSTRKSVRAASGVSPDKKKGTPLMGDVAANILDLAGIVCNRNTIPGDKSARTPSGIRLGTPWITQRGFKEPEVDPAGRDHRQRAEGAAGRTRIAGRRGPVYSARIDVRRARGGQAGRGRPGLLRRPRPGLHAVRLPAPLLHVQGRPRIRAASGTSSRSRARTRAASAMWR